MLLKQHKSRREYIYIIMNLVEFGHYKDLRTRREHDTINTHSQDLDELMYDDYDLDYTFSNDYNLDEDAYYEHYTQLDASDLDEDYVRDAQDYNTLAYRHYA